MKFSEYDSIINELKDDMKKLLDSEIFNIVDIEKGSKYFPGIYAIRRPDSNEIVYVGQTKAGISNRMHQHLHMNGGSDLQIILRDHPEYPQDKTMYRTHYLEIQDERKRLFVESFIISVLQPSFNG